MNSAIAVFQLITSQKKETSAFEAFSPSLGALLCRKVPRHFSPISLFRAMALGLGHSPLARFLSRVFLAFSVNNISISIGLTE